MGRQPCCDKSGLKRGSWTIEEDQKLINFIANNGIHCWRLVPKLAGLMRCGKSCRLRWTNYLRPDLKRGPLSEAEEDQIIQLHSRLGNRWSKIASHFPSRTDNEIKNLWNTKIKKRLKLHNMPIVENKESSAVAHNIEPHEYYSCPPPELLQEDQFKKEVDDGEVLSLDAHEEMMNNNDNVLVVPVQQANTCTTSSSCCSTPFSLDETLINTSTVEGADQASNYWSDSFSSWEALSYLEDVLSFVNFP